MIKFSNDYDKLHHPIFPTIRSVEYMKKHNLKIGDIDNVTTPLVNIRAMLVSYQDSQISKIPFKFLEYDVSPLNIYHKQDFVNILNSFLPKGWGRNRLTTIKRILWWMEVD